MPSKYFSLSTVFVRSSISSKQNITMFQNEALMKFSTGVQTGVMFYRYTSVIFVTLADNAKLSDFDLCLQRGDY